VGRFDTPPHLAPVPVEFTMRRSPSHAVPCLVLLLVLVSAASATPTFSPAARYACPGVASVTDVAVGDIDEDGRPDIVGTMGPAWDHPIFWLRGTGSAAFAAMQGIELYIPFPNSIALGRLRGAGSHLDLVATASGTNAVWIVPGNGDGTFAQGMAASYATGLAPTNAVTGFVNGDDALDFAVVNFNSNTVAYWLGDGSLGFGVPMCLGTGIGPGPVSQADMDADGLPDLVLTSRAPGAVHVVRLDPTSRDYYPRTDFSAPGAVPNAVADFTGDGVPDVAESSPGQVRIVGNNGYGTLALRPEIYAATGVSPALAAADLDGDGKTDLVRANADDSTVSVWPGNGDGTLGTRADYVVGATPLTLATADLDGDGDLDVVVGCNGDPQHVAVLRNLKVAAAVPPVDAPRRIALLAPRPNPARAGVTLALELPAATTASVRVVDAQGRTVRVLAADAPFAAGRATLEWDGRDASGRPAGTGLYFVHLRTADGTADARKLELVR
jgi:hypothetical protein